ncbi:hypothetical protein BCR41DRAFT_365032 [Lobosporangium transversale]|uniref:Uncharacterized protein n=1 Tax=Lobosporangium transversale TaxID=64571 RepID=A0A1Y2G7F1_9FUNG|nr:hypothetical protein BCR41DRAFT_365032 [Lobosporangium transversale]ORY96007.1 hypothetical protein BCR41DRAFT_365032 [Lobosporangium transversale]|eukprot:XP_021875444.1 hypothetical protein BCR41DRAFT_365032 [Lobosporangium transversale]
MNRFVFPLITLVFSLFCNRIRAINVIFITPLWASLGPCSVFIVLRPSSDQHQKHMTIARFLVRQWGTGMASV